MDLLPHSDFKQEESREHEDEKEHPVLDRALDVSISVEDRQELRTEKRFRTALVVKRSFPVRLVHAYG